MASLTSVTIGKGAVLTIGDHAFDGDSLLSKLVIDTKNALKFNGLTSSRNASAWIEYTSARAAHCGCLVSTRLFVSDQGPALHVRPGI